MGPICLTLPMLPLNNQHYWWRSWMSTIHIKIFTQLETKFPSKYFHGYLINNISSTFQGKPPLLMYSCEFAPPFPTLCFFFLRGTNGKIHCKDTKFGRERQERGGMELVCLRGRRVMCILGEWLWCEVVDWCYWLVFEF